MATDVTLKDMGDVYARLFDHRPVTQGEINFTLNEFENKRGESEFNHLQKILEYNREISEKLIPDCQKTMDEYMPKIMEKLNAGNKRCKEILEKEGSSSKDEWLLEQREARVDQWSSFMDEMCDASEKVDQEHDAEIQQVKQYYEDIEKHLKINERS